MAAVIAIPPQQAGGPAAARSTLPSDVAAKTILNTTPRHREWVHVPAGARTVETFIVYPERTNGAPVVLVTSDKGATDWIRAVGDQIAAEGFIAVVPEVLPGFTAELDAVRRHALSLPSADGKSASIEFSSGITGVRIHATAGRSAQSFRATSQEWPRITAFLNEQTGSQPVFGQNPHVPEDHSAHMAAMAMLQQPASATQAPQASQPVGYPQGKLPNLPAGRYTAKSTLARSALRGEFVNIPVGNANLRTWVVYPAGNGRAPVVLVMQHGLGLDEWMRALADQLAQQGFIAVAPDLYSGFGPNGGNWESFLGTDEVMRAGGRLTQDEGMRRYKAAYDWAMKLPRASGKSATIGFCAGGGYSFRFAGEVPEVNAAVSFYGGSPNEAIMTRIKAPVLAFYGEDDARVTAAAAPTAANMQRLGKSFEYHIYPHATHAFLDYQSLGGNPAATADSWARTTAFLDAHTK
jgi:carboxymethylenebutenolidase